MGELGVQPHLGCDEQPYKTLGGMELTRAEIKFVYRWQRYQADSKAGRELWRLPSSTACRTSAAWSSGAPHLSVPGICLRIAEVFL